jgi:hypothetical protein
MQGYLQRRIAAKYLQKRQVAVFIGLLENVFKIANGLMIVERQDQADGVGHCYSFIVY